MAPDNPQQKGAAPAKGECDHFQPADLARLAEEYLKGKAAPPESWEGARFGYGAGGGTGPFKAVITEIERRQGNWVVVRLDRKKTELTEAEAGFRVIREN